MAIKDYGLRVVVCSEAYYEDYDSAKHVYWTDEPVMTLGEYYEGKTYRRVKHPDGLVPKSGCFVGVA